MTGPLPLLLSVPHAGLEIPPEVAELNLLTPKEIAEDGDEGAAAIYLPLERRVTKLVTTPIARAYVDMNRAEGDIWKDGVVKTHTCWDRPIYPRPLYEEEIEPLMARYHRPYHRALSEAAGKGVVLAVDCHTMAAFGPPVAPDPGVERPAVCLGSGDGTLPAAWLTALKRCFEEAFQREVAINQPFSGGHTIRAHAGECPWIQLELSRAPYWSDERKGRAVLSALEAWCALGQWRDS